MREDVNRATLGNFVRQVRDGLENLVKNGEGLRSQTSLLTFTMVGISCFICVNEISQCIITGCCD